MAAGADLERLRRLEHGLLLRGFVHLEDHGFQAVKAVGLLARVVGPELFDRREGAHAGVHGGKELLGFALEVFVGGELVVKLDALESASELFGEWLLCAAHRVEHCADVLKALHVEGGSFHSCYCCFF